MTLRSLAFLLALSLGLLAGCPSSTTLMGDGGADAFTTADLGRPDAPGAADTGTPPVDTGTAAADTGSSDTGSSDTGAPPPDAGPPTSWSACNHTSECALFPSGCCATCGTPGLSDVDAVNSAQSAAHFTEVCPAPVPCPRCATRINPSLIASCAFSRCAEFDLTMMPISACTTDTDCVVRYASCCGCSGDASSVVSIRSDMEGAIESLLCDAHTCPLDCAPARDPGFRAACDPGTGHCTAIAL